MFFLIEIHYIHIYCHGNYIEMEKDVYVLEINI